ncbi:hypothetical protein HK098_002438 [Nowakowskiella sp. JEL0407]|nr:hypothetical protein HK098_002438 [Nowakowskiella sp. JEL0407]
MPPITSAKSYLSPTESDHSTKLGLPHSESYSLPAHPLTSPSRKPRHLQSRFSHRLHSHSMTAATDARQAFLEARRLNLSAHNNKIKTLKISRQLSLLAIQSKRKASLQNRVSSANKNRQKLLQSQRDSAAEVVQKAKIVAIRQNKLTKQQQEELRDRLNERMRLSEQRRLEKMKFVPRSKLAEVDPKEFEALVTGEVILIQRRWRYWKLAPVVEKFWDLGLTLKSASEKSFEELTKLLQEERTIAVIDEIFDRIYLGINEEDGFESRKKNHSRLFLSTYLMVAQKGTVMDDETVSNSAKTSLEHFESWLRSISSPASYAMLRKFLTTWSSFIKSFNQWKAKDTEKLIDGMVAHWIDIERLWLSVMHQVDADTQWRPRIEKQQRAIVSKLQRFGKAGMQKLREEQQKLRSEIASNEPEDSDSVMASEEDSDAIITDTEGSASDVLSTSPQKFPARRPSRSDSVTLSSRDTSLSPHRVPGSPKRSTGSPSRSLTSSPTRLASSSSMPADATSRLKTSVSTEFASLVSTMAQESNESMAQLNNEQLAHELVLDPDFEMTKRKVSPVEERVREMAKRAFFDSIKDGFKTGKHTEYLPGLLQDIQKQLLSIVNEGGKIYNEITQTLDIELITQQLEHTQTVDLRNIFGYVVTRMGQLCAPIRDSGIRELKQLLQLIPESLHKTFSPDESQATAFVDFVQHVFTNLESMKLDLANYKLRQLRPVIAQQAVEYESKKFEDQMQKSGKGLVATKTWLESAANTLKEVRDKRNPEGIDIIENKIRFEDVYNEALLSLVFSTIPLSVTETVNSMAIPETLHLDAKRLETFQNDSQAITIIATLVMLAKNSIPKLRNDKLVGRELTDSVWELLQEEDVNVGKLVDEVLSVINSGLVRMENAGAKSSVSAVGKWLVTKEQEALVRNMVEKTLSPKNTVFSLVARRLAMVLKQFLSSEENLGVMRKEGVSLAGDSRAIAGSEVVSAATYASAGLDMVKEKVELLGRKLAALSRHNKRVHAVRYDAILGELLK